MNIFGAKKLHYSELRSLAEARLSDKPGEATISPEQKLLQELRVHQIELEMQNEALRETQIELEMSRDRYFELYNLAPVGYVTLNEKGLILEANLTTANMLDEFRSVVINQFFTNFIQPDDLGIYYEHKKQCLASEQKQSCELRILTKNGKCLWVRLETTPVKNSHGEKHLHTMLNNISEIKSLQEALQTCQNSLAAK
ncbi:MAG: PAS domain-containing protein [Gallionellaceae bacterium]|jgi:PAS domain S-box-containing protein